MSSSPQSHPCRGSVSRLTGPARGGVQPGIVLDRCGGRSWPGEESRRPNPRATSKEVAAVKKFCRICHGLEFSDFATSFFSRRKHQLSSCSTFPLFEASEDQTFFFLGLWKMKNVADRQCDTSLVLEGAPLSERATQTTSCVTTLKRLTLPTRNASRSRKSPRVR